MKQELVCLGHTVTLHEASGDYDLLEGVSLPQVPGPPPHHHKGYHELFLVQQGALEFLVDGQAVTVAAGESINLPPNTVHTFCNVGQEPCRFLNVHSPKGFRSFFEEFGVEASQPNALATSVDEQIIGQVLTRAASFDMHLAQA
ncbi:cupin domain-containing protein [Hymenobacter sp. HD11105]|jgi:mannose-6-phosphate isomerase-like protein (cupin superfamily)